MISKVGAFVELLGGLVIALILSYYMNIRFDQKTVIPFLKHQFKTLVT